MTPLSAAERQFAEENHGLLYATLHQKGIPLDYYGDLAEWYLRAVRTWFSRPDLRQKYRFGTIVACTIQSGYLQLRQRQARAAAAVIISLDEPAYDDRTYSEMYPSPFSNPEDQVSDLMPLLHSKLSRAERRVFPYLVSGYPPKEIADILGISRSGVSQQIGRIRRKAVKLIGS